MLVTQNFPPFSYPSSDSPGEAAGPAVEIVRAACHAAALDCRIELLPWIRAQDYVRTGRANGMFLIGWNQERAGWLAFSPALVQTEYGLFVRSDSHLQYKRPDDLKGLSVAVYGPSNTATAFEALRARAGGAVSVEMRPDSESGFRKLSVGHVDVVFSNRAVGEAIIARLGLGNLRYAGATEQLSYYVAFSRAHTPQTLIERFNSGCNELIRNGTLARLLSNAGISPPPRQ